MTLLLAHLPRSVSDNECDKAGDEVSVRSAGYTLSLHFINYQPWQLLRACRSVDAYGDAYGLRSDFAKATSDK